MTNGAVIGSASKLDGKSYLWVRKRNLTLHGTSHMPRAEPGQMTDFSAPHPS